MERIDAVKNGRSQDGRARRPDMVRVVLAEDHPMFLAAVNRLLSEHSGVDIVGIARDGSQALALVRGKKPDVALLDITMPGLDGLAVLKSVIAEALPTRIVFLSGIVDPGVVQGALAAGAAGYVSKDSADETVIGAVQAVARGETAVSSDLQVAVMNRLRQEETLERLSKRENEVLILLADGLRGPAIASKLHISTETVKSHTRSLYAKLGSQSAAGAVAEAMRRGLLQ